VATPQVLSADAAAALIAHGDTVVCAGFVGAGHAEAVTSALERRFVAQGSPRDLTLVYAAGQGDRLRRGVNHFGHAGLVKRIIGGHWISAPRLGQLVRDNAVEAYNLPQGVITHLYRAIAGGKLGVVTPIGLHTFVDPRRGGGALNARSTAPVVELITLQGREQLFYPSFPVHVALIRATSADENGNLSTEHEPFHQDLLAIAQAAHNSGGKVIAQVKRLVPNGSLDPNLVRVPGILVDHLVVTQDPAEHWMTFGEQHNPAYLCARTLPQNANVTTAVPLDARRIIQRRALLELASLRSPVVNLGVGMPAGVGALAREEGYTDFTLTVESGPIGGTPADKLSFGASAFPEAIIDHAAMFDFYDGGGLDIAFLGMAEFDPLGNVNVSRFGDVVAGVGGFINITQSTSRVVFMGALTGGGLRVRADGGRLLIEQEGSVSKLVPEVQQLSFNGPYVAGLGRRLLYITERAVFELRGGRLTLTEIAPGINVADVLALAAAPVAVAEDLRRMDARIYRDAPMFAAAPAIG
jgi:propionate CoA-transferase